MANIVLKDKNGANVVYKNVDYVSFQTLEGGIVRFNERAADIISVTELPTEAINDNAIYRLTTKDDNGNTIVEFYVHENSGEWIEVAEGAKMSDLVVTENGEYTPVEDEDGFAKVTVDIDTFTDVEEFPMENIDQEAIYRVVRQDEETGTTYTTYGIFDADDTKTVLEYNAEEGWVECGAGGGDIQPVEITANGTYDATIVSVGELEAGARYTYKREFDKETMAALLSYADENGRLHGFSVESDLITTGIIQNGEEYMLIANSMGGMGQYYCTAEMVYNDKTYPAGWSIVGNKFSDSMDASVPLAVDESLPIIMRMPDVIDDTTIFGSDGMLEFYQYNLLDKKVNMEVVYPLGEVDGTVVGTIGEKSMCLSALTMSIDQVKEFPILTIPVSDSTTAAQAYMSENLYQHVLFSDNGYGNTTGVSFIETDAYFNIPTMLNMFYIKDLSAESDVEISGDFVEGKWYMPSNFSFPEGIGLYDYYPTRQPCDGYNPVVVNIPNADTIVEVKELPTTGVKSDKIYKKVVRTAKYTVIANMDGRWSNIEPLIEALVGGKITVIGVETLPDTFIPTTETEMYLYIVLSTGEMVISEDGTTTKPQMFGFNTSQFGGVAEDPSYVPEDSNAAYFFLKYYDEFITYGLPNNGTDKQYYEYNEKTSAWDELDSGDMLMARVDELPAENVNDGKVYCVKNEIEAMTEVYAKQDNLSMTISEYVETMKSVYGIDTAAVEYYVVDELTTNPVVTIYDEAALNIDFHIYILASTGEPYVSTDGTTCVFLGESGLMFSGEYKGKITDVNEATENGYYTIMRDASVSYTYGIPNDGDNKTIMVYRNGTWIRFVEETPAVEPEEPTDPEATT